MPDRLSRLLRSHSRPQAHHRIRLPVSALVALSLFLVACDRTPEVRDAQPREFPETGGTVLTVRGDGFRARTRITLNGSVLPDTTVVDRTTLRVTLPPSKPGSVRIGAVTLPNVPSRTSVRAAYVDVTPPRVIGWEPAGALPPDATTDRIRVTFSEPIEKASLDLQDDAGAGVAGVTTRDGAVLTFAPSDPLRAGRGYVASIHGVTDARGNEAATERLRFSTAARQ